MRTPFRGSQTMLCVAVLFIHGCGSGSLEPQHWPESASDRREPLLALGEAIFEAARAQRPGSLLVSDSELPTLLREDAAAALRPARQAAMEGPAGGTAGTAGPAGRVAMRFVAACIQQSRIEHPTGSLGLLKDGWVVDRLLVEGQRADGARLGAWAEGSFLFTGEKFVGLVISRLETLRWQHADLELATCDQRVRVGPDA